MFRSRRGPECTCPRAQVPNQKIDNVVAEGGLEPPRCCHQQILSLPRLPIPPLGRVFRICDSTLLFYMSANAKNIRASQVVSPAT